MVALGLCAAIFVASNQEDGDAISNILNPAMRTALAQVALARTSKLVLGAGQEDADMKAIQTAWATFQDSENASVRAPHVPHNREAPREHHLLDDHG